MRLDCGACVIRSYRHDDAEAIVREANDPNVARYMSDQFPSPYAINDARQWLSRCMDIDHEESQFAIELEKVFVGGLGFTRFSGERRFTAEYGYWLGTGAWGKGIATAASLTFLDWMWKETDFERIQAHAYAPNVASRRVLEKIGLRHEGTLRRHIFKNGEFYDALLFAILRGGSDDI